MRNFKNIALETGLLFATTVGAGMFSLPYVFKMAGFPIGFFYFIFLGTAIIFIHYLYFQVLKKENEKSRLLGLVKKHFGSFGEKSALLIIIGGLVLELLVYLILGKIFFEIIIPQNNWGLIIFWILGSLPIFFRLRILTALEFLGAALIAFLVFFIFLTSPLKISNLLSFNLDKFFLPFGASFFALAGWTAVEPIFEREKSAVKDNSKIVFVFGTILAIIFYTLFVLALYGLALTPDALTGLKNEWPNPKLVLAAILGLFLILTSYWPIGLEIKNGLEKDLRWPRFLSASFVLFSPLFLYAIGLRSLLSVLSIAGGVFLSLQYFLIALVAKKSLNLSAPKKFLVNLFSFVFASAAIYEIFYFVK